MVIFTHINPGLPVITPDGDGLACMVFQDSITGKSYMVLFNDGNTNTYKEEDIIIKEM